MDEKETILTEKSVDKKIEKAAQEILERFAPAFEELAK